MTKQNHNLLKEVLREYRTLTKPPSKVVYYVSVPPMSLIDPSVTRDEHTFAVNVGLEGHTLRSCGHPLGRRTVVSQCEGAKRLVIKEQYLRCSAEIPEDTILRQIHEQRCLE